ncbi:MAG: hypothetical protein R3293_25075 [Candidatus Promineifilaceae bacterium]|nr:hypothetical protein [Candidatus Promineifilaceae bacterium]
MNTLQAYLVVDNSFLVMLTDFFCAELAGRMTPERVLSELGQRLCAQIDILRRFAVGSCVYCSDQVAGEFKPWHSERITALGKIPFPRKQDLAAAVTAELVRRPVEEVYFDILRSQPDAPRRLVGPNGLSNEDLSLIMVGIELTANGQPVYVLSNDQDLLEFTTWLRRKPEARELWPEIGQLNGLHCLTYLELVHRSCHISTDLIRNLINFYIRDHYSRHELVGTSKGESILEQLLSTYSSLTKSAEIKAKQGAAA